MTHIEVVVAEAVEAERERCACIVEAVVSRCAPGTADMLTVAVEAIRDGVEAE